MPPGVVNVVHGYGEEAGEALVRHPDVPVITFTGSRETGVAVTKAAADLLKHVHLELGGKNAIIVMDDADVDLAVDGIVWSAFGTTGQRCTAASRVIVHEAVYGELSSKLVAAAEQLRLGPGWEASTDVGPLINRAALEKVAGYTEIGKDEGAKLLTGGEAVAGEGFFYRPTVFADVEAGMRIAQEEIFGPTTALIPVKSFEEAVAAANSVSLRALVLDLHPRRQPRLPGDARPPGRDHVHQRGHDRRRGAPAVRRHEGHRQRPPRGGPGSARRLHRVEVDLRRLLGPAPAGPDRQSVNRKLVVFVPPEALEAVRDAIFAAGAGRIGDYERCSWYTEGIGTFRPLPGANPAVGEVGEEEHVPELRLETVFPAEAHDAVVAALRAAHPYEEPAFDVYALL